jgi:2',3'-cyclic-nucleotide 2'-phosphodiesterase
MNKFLEVLFLGDIVGRPGRYSVEKYLKEIGEKPDFVIANAENASHGFGLTEKNYFDLLNFGIDALTSGNHVWDKKEIFNYIHQADKLIRPLNYPCSVPGKGFDFFEVNGLTICVINLLGRVFMNPIGSPWDSLEKVIKLIKEKTNIIIIDFHAEATAEKISMGYFADNLGVSAVIGTHTHVQTSDEKILDKGCAYITDVGFCGVYNGVIGMETESSLKRLTTGLPERYDVAISNLTEINAVKIMIDPQSGRSNKIERIRNIYNLKGES